MKFRYCIVDIKGGFGNQLFQYSFANHLKKLGYKVKVNNYFYFDLKHNNDLTYREEILSPSMFGFKIIKKSERKILSLLKRIKDSKKLQKINTLFLNKVFGYFKEKDLIDVKKILPISHFDGYWQDIDYLDTEFIKKTLFNIEEIKISINKDPIKNSNMILVRRGDYIKMGQDLSIDFYRECFEIISKFQKDPLINVFTDDILWVKNNPLFNAATNIYGPEDSPEKVLSIFCKMIENENFFIGNSTFSYFAAILGKKENSKVFVADPWFRDRESKNLILKNWKTINNK